MIVIVALIVLLAAVVFGFTGVDQFTGNTKRLQTLTRQPG